MPRKTLIQPQVNHSQRQVNPSQHQVNPKSTSIQPQVSPNSCKGWLTMADLVLTCVDSGLTWSWLGVDLGMTWADMAYCSEHRCVTHVCTFRHELWVWMQTTFVELAIDIHMATYQPAIPRCQRSTNFNPVCIHQRWNEFSCVIEVPVATGTLPHYRGEQLAGWEQVIAARLYIFII